MADFLLIHGAWHGGWCWDRVRPILEEAGHRVVAPTLSGLEQQRTETVEGIDLTTHGDDVVGAALDLESDDLILVGHSYAGFVVTGAADRLREEVTLYVYLDAGLPAGMDPGSSFAWSDSLSPERRRERLDAITDLGLGPVLPAPPPEAFGVESDRDIELLAERTRPMPAGTVTGSVTMERGGSEGLDRIYVHSVDPAYPPLGDTPERAASDPTWEYMELATGHDSMLTAPTGLAGLLDRLARSG
jgi:pimeloyl-ACP methyl ester carboxylesterase